MPFHAEGLSVRELRMIEKLVETCQLLDSVYWRQSDYGGFQVYKTTRDATMRSLLGVMGGRWDLLDSNHFFLGEMPMPPGREWYPQDLTRAGLDQYHRSLLVGEVLLSSQRSRLAPLFDRFDAGIGRRRGVFGGGSEHRAKCGASSWR
jgi:hypothetical protein